MPDILTVLLSIALFAYSCMRYYQIYQAGEWEGSTDRKVAIAILIPPLCVALFVITIFQALKISNQTAYYLVVIGAFAMMIVLRQGLKKRAKKK